MLPFRVTIEPGTSPARQIVYAATRAVVSGELPAGAAFPSVRELSLALKINPNTAHKVVAELVRDGLLEVLPGVGTVVSAARRVSPGERRQLLSKEVEQLAVEAKRLGLSRDDVVAAVEARWSELFGDESPTGAANSSIRKSTAPRRGARS
jgi:GntR family transcriptional regulator